MKEFIKEVIKGIVTISASLFIVWWANKLLFGINILVNSENETSPTPTPFVVSEKSGLENKKWHCKVVLNCEWADWSISDPQDYCTYEFQNYVQPENPEKEIANVSYGGWCKEIK